MIGPIPHLISTRNRIGKNIHATFDDVFVRGPVSDVDVGVDREFENRKKRPTDRAVEPYPLDFTAIPAKNGKTTIMFFHGNGGNISHRLDSIKIFNSLGLNVFIFDYRGYGNSAGSASELNTYDDGISGWEYLIKNRGEKAEDIIIFGRSLGGSIASYLGTKLNPKGIILESVFTSVKDLADTAYPFVPRSLIRFGYETKNYVKDIHSPVLIIHSSDDEIVPFNHGEVIFQNANEPKSFMEISGSHNHGFLESKNQYISGLKNFLEEIDEKNNDNSISN